MMRQESQVLMSTIGRITGKRFDFLARILADVSGEDARECLRLARELESAVQRARQAGRDDVTRRGRWR
jgi:hypothetical protein